MLPKNLKYGSKVESAIARSFRSNIAPQNGTGNYIKGDTIIINIPTRNNLVLASTESYLKFNLTVTNGNFGNQTFRFDSCGAHGLIQRLRIFHGSNLIQDIDNYGLLCKILFDLQQPTDATYGKLSVLSGTRSDVVLTTPTVAAVADISQKNLPAFQANSGERIGGPLSAVTAANATTAAETFCLNLVSLLGSLSASNYIPLFGMTSAPLRLELQLVDAPEKAIACSQGLATAFTISNCEYVANFIELGDPAMGIIYGNLGGGPLEYVVPDFRNYQFTANLVQNTATQINMPIPAKFSSLKSLVVTTRQNTGANAVFPYSCLKSGLVDYQFRIGAQVVPSKPPASVSEFFSEVCKCYGSIADLNYTPSIDRRSYVIDTNPTYTESDTQVSAVNSGSFYIGIDLENYTAAPKETIFAGMNTNTDDIYFVGNFTTPNNYGNTRFDAFANFDTVLVCENNIAYIKF